MIQLKNKEWSTESKERTVEMKKRIQTFYVIEHLWILNTGISQLTKWEKDQDNSKIEGIILTS
jgi:hypothetical protein